MYLEKYQQLVGNIRPMMRNPLVKPKRLLELKLIHWISGYVQHSCYGSQISKFVSEIEKKSLSMEQKTAHCVRLVGNVRPMMRNPIVKWKRGIYISSSNGLAKYAHEMAHAFIYYPSQTRTFFRVMLFAIVAICFNF